MNRASIAVRVVSLLAFTLVLVGVTTGQEIFSERLTLGLCKALQEIKQGERLSVVARGVLGRNFLFYDPGEPRCPTDVQPTTVVEFEAPLPRNAAKWLKQDGRVILTVEGTLIGPKAVDESSKGIALAGRVANWLRARYEFHNTCRTKLVVKRVTSYERVPPYLPWEALLVRPHGSGSLPKVLSGDLPTYPWEARRLSVEGSVVLTLRIVNGEIHEAQIVHADDPILAAAARDNVLTWKFQDEVTRILTTTFTYQLERRNFSADDNPVVEARLPAYVRIVGPRLDW